MTAHMLAYTVKADQVAKHEELLGNAEALGMPAPHPAPAIARIRD